jgi:nucleotide-binding universal stress UspA family protein
LPRDIVGRLLLSHDEVSFMKVLLGIGGSEDSLRALEKAVDRAKEAGDELTIAIVENPESEREPAEIRERVDEALSEADFEADVRQLSGHPGSQLLELAEREGYERIVLGGGETSPLGKVQLGSIAEFVLLNAQTSVTLIR